MEMSKRILAAAVALSLAAPAFAGVTGVVEDPYGGRSVAMGRIDKVDQRLSTAFKQGDHSPEVLINLAAIRLQQRDTGKARELYRMVLAQPNVDMATLRGSAWSHEIARRGLASEMVAANW
jgi:hypothetical protein